MTKPDGSDEAAEARKRRRAILNTERLCDISVSEGARSILAISKQLVEATANAANAERQYSDSGNETGRSDRAMSVASTASSGTHGDDDDDDGEPSNKKSKKTQVRYDPSVPMSKEELANWRREHRRVRNRESAAASRQRTRSRITELEGEVEQWKSKYNTAMQRLTSLREANTAPSASDQQDPPEDGTASF